MRIQLFHTTYVVKLEKLMKLLLISAVLAGAGGVVVHAKDDVAKKVMPPTMKKFDATKIERTIDTFILVPRGECVVEDINSINNCLNTERKWIKAI